MKNWRDLHFLCSPKLVWGNQEPMWTLKRATLTATATPRLEQLAMSKVDHRPPDNFMYVPYYPFPQTRLSPLSLSLSSLSHSLSLPLSLSLPPSLHTHTHTHLYPHCSPEFQYSCGRNSQIWKVSPLAMKAVATQQVQQLSRHKTAPGDYLEHRPQFAYSCGRSSQIWTTSKAAMSCRPRPRTATLSRSKQTHSDYRPSRQVLFTCTVYK